MNPGKNFKSHQMSVNVLQIVENDNTKWQITTEELVGWILRGWKKMCAQYFMLIRLKN